MNQRNTGPFAAHPRAYRTSRSLLSPQPQRPQQPLQSAPGAEPALVDAVRRAFNLDALEARCRQSVEQLLGPRTREGRYKYIDNGSLILAVAHCDVVSGLPVWFAASRGQPDGDVVFSPALDDRLGVYTILDLLPKLGIAVDVLLTDDEECAQSTAGIFVPGKKYNWGVEFDRRGEDAVCYRYVDMEDPAARYFRVGRGTFSDISCLQAGCQCLNVGVGYVEEHTEACRCHLEVYFRQIARFLAMYRDLATTTMPYKYDNAPFRSPVRDFDFFDRCPDPTRNSSDFRDFDSWADEVDRSLEEEYFDRAVQCGVCPYCDEGLTESLVCLGCGRSYVPRGKSFSIATAAW